MINSFFIFLLLLFFVFLTTQKTTTYVFKLLFYTTRVKTLALWVTHLLFLPGTVIHELSHWLVAKLLRVKTGKLSILPKIEEKGRGVKTGSLEIESVDFFRLSLIGLAPLVSGLFIIYIIGSYFFPSFSPQIVFRPQLSTFLGAYLLFSISSTMFSSKKDIKPLIIAVPFLTLISAAFYFSNAKVAFTQKFINGLNIVFYDLNRYLLLVAVIDGIVYIILKGAHAASKRLKNVIRLRINPRG